MLTESDMDESDDNRSTMSNHVMENNSSSIDKDSNDSSNATSPYQDAVDISSHHQTHPPPPAYISETSPSYTASNDIPQYLWDIFPESATYLREIMKLSGYETISSVVKLDSKLEREKMINFTISVWEGLDDEQRRRVFGIFHKIPGKLMILPGLEIVFDEFIQSVKKLKTKLISEYINFQQDNSSSTATPPSNYFPFLSHHQKAVRDIKRARFSDVTPPQPISVDEIRSRMQKWFLKQNSSVNFTVVELSTTPNCFQFTCGLCKWITNITREHTGKISLSNVQRHYRLNKCTTFQKTKSIELQQIEMRDYSSRYYDENQAYVTGYGSQSPLPEGITVVKIEQDESGPGNTHHTSYFSRFGKIEREPDHQQRPRQERVDFEEIDCEEDDVD